MFNNIDKKQLKDNLNKLLVYALILYVFFILGRSVWANFQLKTQIDAIKNQISTLQAQNKNVENLILYYQSDSFREVEARSKLGLKKPGETVVAVPTAKYAAENSNYEAETAAEAKSMAPKPTDASSSNWQNWLNYFTK